MRVIIGNDKLIVKKQRIVDIDNKRQDVGSVHEILWGTEKRENSADKAFIRRKKRNRRNHRGVDRNNERVEF